MIKMAKSKYLGMAPLGGSCQTAQHTYIEINTKCG